MAADDANDADDTSDAVPGRGPVPPAGGKRLTSSQLDLLESVADALWSPDPLNFLGLASSAVAMVVHPAPAAAGERRAPANDVLEALTLAYLDAHLPESVAFATALAAFTPDDGLRRTLDLALDGAGDGLPGWLAHLDDAHVERTVRVRDVFADVETLIVGVHLADGRRFCVTVHLDHGLDGAVSDGFLVPRTVDDLVGTLGDRSPDAETRLGDVPVADATTRLREGLAATDALPEPPRTATWPLCRPLLEWALRLPPPADRRTAHP